jgi:NAD(P)-dependent dehydrogenase (short-subunit alcohol dehydrogenase family)
VQAAVERTVNTFGALHYAVNHAGVAGAFGPLEEISVEDWNRVIGIDLSSLFYVVKYAAPAIVAARGGAIVNVSSVFASPRFGCRNRSESRPSVAAQPARAGVRQYSRPARTLQLHATASTSPSRARVTNTPVADKSVALHC